MADDTVLAILETGASGEELEVGSGYLKAKATIWTASVIR
jgi:hypothetical protein